MKNTIITSLLMLALFVSVNGQQPRTETQKRIGALCSDTLRPANVDSEDSNARPKQKRVKKVKAKAKAKRSKR